MSHKYSWTVTSKYYYDQTLTTDLLKKDLADRLDSSGRDTVRYTLYNMADLSVWPATLFDQVDIQNEIRSLLDCKVDVVSKRGLHPYIRHRVLAEAVEL